MAAVAVAAHAAPVATARTAAAPADEYFGAQKMSALGIRMRVDALGRAYHARTIADGDLVHDAAIAETSLAAWSRLYPRDPWLAPTTFHLEQLYGAVQSPQARARALALLHVLAATYGATSFGHQSRLRLQQGFPPLHAESPVVPPSPAAVPAVAAPSADPAASASPGPPAPAAPAAGATSLTPQP